MDALVLLFADNRGIYIPQNYAEEIDHSKVNGVDPDDLDILRAGPDHEWYWEAWENVLNNAEYTTEEGTWRLYQDGDCWLVNDDMMTDQEYLDFYGEPREQ